MKKENQKVLMAIVLALTLGLAPFIPEPHLFGKVKWIISGGEGMAMMDYFDLLLHGGPWLYLIFTIFGRFNVKVK